MGQSQKASWARRVEALRHLPLSILEVANNRATHQEHISHTDMIVAKIAQQGMHTQQEWPVWINLVIQNKEIRQFLECLTNLNSWLQEQLVDILALHLVELEPDSLVDHLKYLEQFSGAAAVKHQLIDRLSSQIADKINNKSTLTKSLYRAFYDIIGQSDSTVLNDLLRHQGRSIIDQLFTEQNTMYYRSLEPHLFEFWIKKVYQSNMSVQTKIRCFKNLLACNWAQIKAHPDDYLESLKTIFGFAGLDSQKVNQLGYYLRSDVVITHPRILDYILDKAIKSKDYFVKDPFDNTSKQNVILANMLDLDQGHDIEQVAKSAAGFIKDVVALPHVHAAKKAYALRYCLKCHYRRIAFYPQQFNEVVKSLVDFVNNNPAFADVLDEFLQEVDHEIWTQDYLSKPAGLFNQPEQLHTYLESLSRLKAGKSQTLKSIRQLSLDAVLKDTWLPPKLIINHISNHPQVHNYVLPRLQHNKVLAPYLQQARLAKLVHQDSNNLQRCFNGPEITPDKVNDQNISKIQSAIKGAQSVNRLIAYGDLIDAKSIADSVDSLLRARELTCSSHTAYKAYQKQIDAQLKYLFTKRNWFSTKTKSIESLMLQNQGQYAFRVIESLLTQLDDVAMRNQYLDLFLKNGRFWFQQKRLNQLTTSNDEEPQNSQSFKMQSLRWLYDNHLAGSRYMEHNQQLSQVIPDAKFNPSSCPY